MIGEEKMTFWTIYNKGTDHRFPTAFVARKFNVDSEDTFQVMDDEPTLVNPDLEIVRDHIMQLGYKLCHTPKNKPKSVLEIWL